MTSDVNEHDVFDVSGHIPGDNRLRRTCLSPKLSKLQDFAKVCMKSSRPWKCGGRRRRRLPDDGMNATACWKRFALLRYQNYVVLGCVVGD